MSGLWMGFPGKGPDRHAGPAPAGSGPHAHDAAFRLADRDKASISGKSERETDRVDHAIDEAAFVRLSRPLL